MRTREIVMSEARKRFPGIGYAYMDENGQATYECYGIADKYILTDDKTIFPACSISKWITAICVMKLQE